MCVNKSKSSKEASMGREVGNETTGVKERGPVNSCMIWDFILSEMGWHWTVTS